MIFEERKTSLFPEKNSTYLEICRDNVWQSIRSSNGSIICSVNGLIGNPQTDILQIIAYPDIESWQTSQGAWSSIESQCIKKESVRILRPINSESKSIIPPEERKAIYEYKIFIIDPVYLNEFNTCFTEAIYPNFQSFDISFLGIWTSAASTNPLEIIQMTGYNHVSHWEQSRLQFSNLNNKSNELWNREKALRDRLEEITLESSVVLMEGTNI